ncbi:PIG-L deacetylase family protein [Massilia sp. Leaf139]|uniref:PIG-L deacetylase family protein n=1 Tax=Massilia sp. Leaf139 TaxID=1736272 RepID=UPI0006FC5D27|nr:PIG-L family deacetylase [Massilia sp. Leaf139]KQQ87768.1 N-acetylglucosaminylphosphatidylinositol deacetylase [Massilia sp. Leaf139]
MRTEEPQRKPAALFLFAHQDDEFGVFHVIEECLRQGRRVACAYLTRGAAGLAARRNDESRRVLTSLGVQERNIVFAGDLLGIDDAHLYTGLEAAHAWIDCWIGGFGRVDGIYVTAWEGGHHDHDVLHALTVLVAQGRGLLPRVRQFALYNHKGCPGPLFRVLSPLVENGEVERLPIPWRRRLAYLRLCLQYPSQRTTWIGLFPFVLLHYVFDGRQALQTVSIERIGQRPHEGILYYEQRHFFDWPRMRKILAVLRTPG